MPIDHRIHIKNEIRDRFESLYTFANQEQDADALRRIRRAMRDNPELLDIFPKDYNYSDWTIIPYLEGLKEYESHCWLNERMFELPNFFASGYDAKLEQEADMIVNQSVYFNRLCYSSILNAKKMYLNGNISVSLFYQKLVGHMITQLIYCGTEFKHPDNTPNLTFLINCKKNYIRALTRQTTVELSALRQGGVDYRHKYQYTSTFRKTYFNLFRELLEYSMSLSAGLSCRGFHSYPSEWFSDYTFLTQEPCYACLESKHTHLKLFKPCHHFVCKTCSENPQCKLITCGMCRQPIRYTLDVKEPTVLSYSLL